MKVLEDENKDTLTNLNNILPNLNDNIALGNSLVDIDFEGNYENILPFSWSNFFGNSKFDAIICNPPYEETKAIKRNSNEFNYLKKKYKSAFRQFDRYFLFIEKSLNHLKEDGQIGFLVPNKWITILASEKLRKMFEEKITSIVNFGSIQMFEGKSTYVCIISINNKSNKNLTYEYVSNLNEWISGKRNKIKFEQSQIDFNKPLILPRNLEEKEIINTIYKNYEYINPQRVKTGIQTSKDHVYVIENYEETDDCILFTKDNKEWKIEKEILKPYIKNKENIYSFKEVKQDSLVIYPYQESNNGVKLIEINKMKTKYPNTLKYLIHYKDVLQKRKISPPSINENEFYKYGRDQNLSYLKLYNLKPKILLAVNQRHGEKYGLDKTGLIYESGGTAGALSIIDMPDECSIYFLLGLFSQPEIELFFKLRSSEFQGKAFARGSDVILDLPIPKIDTDEKKRVHDQIIEKVKEIFEINTYFTHSTEEKKLKINFLNSKIKNLFQKFWN